MKAGDQVGRWTLLYPGRNAAGTHIWLCQCRCLTIRELYEADLTPRAGWACGHRSTPTPRPKIGKSSRFRGVSDDRARCLTHPWRVAMYLDGVHCYVGRYATEEEAARAYDRAALELLGPTAIVNFPREEGTLTA